MENVKLTKADKIILSHLEHDGRIAEKALAHHCRLSKDTIRYRMKRLEKLGIIRGYTSFVDYTKLGFESYKLYLKLSGTDEEIEGFKSYLKKHKNLFAIFDSYGNWTLALAIFTRTRKEYYELENDIFSKFEHLILSKKFCNMVDAFFVNNGFFITGFEGPRTDIWNDPKDYVLDDIDRQIIIETHKDCKTTLVNLSEKTGLSIDAVRKRLKSLEDRKIISFYQAAIDYAKLGFDHYKLFIYVKNYDEEVENKIIYYLSKQRYALNLIRIVGPWKLEVEFHVPSITRLEGIIKGLRNKFPDNIKDVEFYLLRNVELFACENLLLA
ncbi:AsnC family transcriptional regulator [Candidatus Woesearchaeota archaeon]|nr:AsnC family transcriptional regulator [Candidatus Woesearchaeota archaeon]